MDGVSHLRGLDIPLEEGADSLLYDRVDTRLLVLVDFVQTDVVLAVAGIAELRHGAGQNGEEKRGEEKRGKGK